MTSRPLPAAPELAPFEQWPAVAHVEVDRFCEGCGYNLQGQTVRRDPRTQILICRCPECGRFHAAADLATVGRLWLQRISSLLLAGWIVIVLWGVVVFGALYGYLMVTAVETHLKFPDHNPRGPCSFHCSSA